MKKGKFFGIGFLFLFLIFVLGACSRESAPRNEGPEGIQMMLDKFPFYEKGVMTDEQIKDLGLVRRKLDAPLVAFNYYRGLGKNGGWQFETLPVGTEVAADNNGRPWYKVDCGNRLYAPAGVADDGSVGAGRRPLGGLGFPWQLLLLPLAILLIWLLLKKLSGADTPGSQSNHPAVGYAGPHVIVPPKSDRPEPKPPISPEFHEKNRPLSDNAGPVMPIITPVITGGETADAEKAQPTETATATEQDKTKKTADGATAAQLTQPTATEAAAAPATLTVGAAIGVLAAHGFRGVRDIEMLPDGDISFNATVRKN